MKLSIITVNRNDAIGLEKTIQSVICQKFTDYEYIVIDGNSTDNSVEIIKKYSEHIHYWVSEPDLGIYNAMNKAIKVVSGEYLIFMNSADCFISSDTLLNVFSKEQTADLLVGSILKNWKRRKERKSPPAKITFYNVRYCYPIPHQSTFIKKKLFDELGLYDESKLGADTKFAFLAIFKYDKSIENLNQDIALMDATGISNSSNGVSQMKKEMDDMIQEYFPYFYDDNKELYQLKRFTIDRLRRHIKWRLRKLIYRQ